MTDVPVLHVVSSMQPGGGPAVVRALARGLKTRGFAPLVAGPDDGALVDAFRADGVDVAIVPTNRLGVSAVARLARLMRDRRIRLVHSHGKGAGLHARLAARGAGVPAVHTFHGIHFEGFSAPARVTYLALERALARITARAVFVSQTEHAEARRLRLVSASAGRVIPNGVDHAGLTAAALDRLAARKSLGLGETAFVVGAVARLDPVKGLDVLVDAMRDAGTAELVVIGDGPQRRALEARAKTSRVRFAGAIGDAARLLRAFDVYATASAKEGLPIAVLEAMALGRPIVASDIPAHREVLGTDYPLTPRTAPAFAEAFAALARDPRRAADLAGRAERRVKDFDFEQMADAMARLYREVLLL
ncbi:MAG: glycosyltransferase [Candidatus Rokubacteria bacterium]|nr:glycosyltransferase [Candidatus Rokubacteria bacterium]